MKNKTTQTLSKLTSKQNIYFTRRGNTSIKTALKLAKLQNKTKVIIQDQGGWITYNQFPDQLKLELIKIKTDEGQSILYELKKIIDKNSIILWNSAPGYICFENNMKDLYDIAKKSDAILINDISGSIGEECSKYGDILLGSFGRWKPLWLDQGGFIASNENLEIEEHIFEEEFYDKLNTALDNLEKRKNFLFSISNNIKKELQTNSILKENILKPEQIGYNVIVKFNNDEIKQNIIKYCDKNNFEYTECPRYIRVLYDAISIEVKRLKE